MATLNCNIGTVQSFPNLKKRKFFGFHYRGKKKKTFSRAQKREGLNEDDTVSYFERDKFVQKIKITKLSF